MLKVPRTSYLLIQDYRLADTGCSQRPRGEKQGLGLPLFRSFFFPVSSLL